MSTLFSPDSDSKKHSDEEQKDPMNSKSTPRIIAVLLGIVMVLSAGQGFYSWSLHNRIQGVESAMQDQFSSQGQDIQGMQEQLGTHEQTFSALLNDLSSTKTRLNGTQGELTKTRKMADQLSKQQKESADQLSSQLGQLQQEQSDTKGTVGAIASDVTGVKQEVNTTKQDLASTRSDLQRTMGDLGVQSGLIATNRAELAELRLLGERDYYEFDLRKASRPQRYGSGVALQLKKTDVKRQKYTINLVSDDRAIEKKDKNTNEPVQFYQQGFRQPSEIVVNQIFKDRIVGYISVPKKKPVAQLSGNEPATSASGS
jgi:septal ring factor EnvC (AmiA/AmiB activator)